MDDDGKAVEEIGGCAVSRRLNVVCARGGVADEDGGGDRCRRWTG